MSLLAQAAQQTAQQSSPNYWIPTITALATILAAIVGFSAAALKHRWDVQDDERRWERERAERRREELRLAFNDYVSSRSALENLFTTQQFPNRGDDNFYALANALFRNGRKLQILLEDDGASIVLRDVSEFTDWLRAINLKDMSTYHVSVAPAEDELIRLAKQLLDP